MLSFEYALTTGEIQFFHQGKLIQKFTFCGTLKIRFLFAFQINGKCKGFAYVHFKSKNDAQTAIDILNGHGYDHLILNVEWSKPQTQN